MRSMSTTFNRTALASLPRAMTSVPMLGLGAARGSSTSLMMGPLQHHMQPNLYGPRSPVHATSAQMMVKPVALASVLAT
eukprot:CAMPEP_0119522920 /NCGR_PEP_ID=MMETSP1344-20130328/38058_1 /TAXON_ID=236787 /ORGANISM="Florenciella parvula, Strain CCMP2471" /LENGTH=78 /DNA_ID=CAMNT_0007560985 /DNA_START=64 /DNA_END=296 /DNA_ORIENTATION=-